MPTAGDRIRQIRETRRLTQDQLAERSGMSKGFLSDIENNKRNPSSEYVLKIADALGASLDYLLRGQEHPAIGQQPVVIPPALAQAAEQLRLSYAQTVALLDAHHSVVARRSDRATKSFTLDDWIKLHHALNRVFG